MVVHSFGALRRVRVVSGVVGGVCAAVMLLGFVLRPGQAAAAYLTAHAFFATISLGALLLLMSCHAMRAGWPTMLRPLFEAMIRPIPLLGLLFLPVLLDAASLYVWVAPPAGRSAFATRALAHKAPYLNLPFFCVRTVVYFSIWSVVAALLLRWADRQAAGDFPGARQRFYAFSAGALPVVALSFVFASFDWYMSLTPLWVSSMYPIGVFAGSALAAVSALTLLALAAERAGLLGVTPSHYYALGRLMLAFTILWAYTGFFQFFLIWIANKPDEVGYFAARTGPGWRAVTLALALGQFVVPFVVLLNYRIKRRGRTLAPVAVWILVFHYVDVHWLVAPASRADGAPYHWLDPVALLAVGGLLVCFAASRLVGRPVEPLHDPRLEEARAYESA